MTTANAKHQRAYRERQKHRIARMEEALRTIATELSVSASEKGRRLRAIATDALAGKGGVL